MIQGKGWLRIYFVYVQRSVLLTNEWKQNEEGNCKVLGIVGCAFNFFKTTTTTRGSIHVVAHRRGR